ncbi:ImmA/IrrE family metallo-endopeptidase [Corynebacterium sp.]|uniref:ImmA/IrrE family metallo-endopeptidase n=1 Tax=Corynebacterium sp. TaxID=1720 RepID=UPI0034CD8730
MRRGLTKASLARSLDVTPRSISNYESHGAPQSQAPRLSEVLEFPVPYFNKPEVPELTDVDVSFRAGARVPARAKRAALASGRHGIEISQWIRGSFVLPRIEVPRVEGLTPEQAARSLREEWGLGTRPLPNLVQLLESKGVHVFGLPPLAEAVDAFSCWSDGIPYVFSARRRTPEGVRFDLAHELGHLVMHSCTTSSFTMDVEQEKEADRFASSFLIPDDSAIEFIPHNPSIEQILKLKEYFQVSAMAMTRKSYSVKRLSEWGYRQACSELSRRGFKTGEPNGSRFYERSRVFDFVYSGERSSRHTPQSIASELFLPVEDVHWLTFQTTLIGLPTRRNESAPNQQEPGHRPHLRVIRETSPKL